MDDQAQKSAPVEAKRMTDVITSATTTDANGESIAPPISQSVVDALQEAVKEEEHMAEEVAPVEEMVGAPVDQPPVAPVEQAVAPIEQAVAPAEPPAVVEQTVAHAEQPVAAAIEPSDVTSLDQTMAPIEHSAVQHVEQQGMAAVEQPAIAPMEQQVVTPMEQQAVAPMEQHTVAPLEQQAVAPVEQPFAPPIEQPSTVPVPIEQPGVPVEQTMAPVEESPAPMEQPINPVQQDGVIQTEINNGVATAAVEEEGAIAEPTEHDVLNGRGASVNAHSGNKKFRALCFSRKPEFEAGNHAAKRRIATEIVSVAKTWPARFLKKKSDKGYWYELSTEKAILKACQVMRDFQRPDRVALREMAAANGNRKRQRTGEPSTPGVEAPPAIPLDPIVENPYGVHSHDVLSGRGAFVNGHVGNQRFRTLSLDRKHKFDAGNYSEKRALATEVVQIIRNLDPPGRFLKRVTNKQAKTEDSNWIVPPRGLEGFWEELSDEKAIHKACQVMRDIDRPDRGPEKRTGFKNDKASDEATTTVNTNGAPTVCSTIEPAATPMEVAAQEADPSGEQVTANAAMTLLAASSNTAGPADATSVEAAAVAAAEAAIENTLGDGVPTPVAESKAALPMSPEAGDTVQV